ncbi:MAG TPA: hypothetical protein VMF07_01245 [Solirubrobacteraceae bacterium]|nr:hypothetical protein [Solirubrobacteraceae bacterium]
MDGGVERLVSSLLYEGYALYPYTPDATKNATPTPFGIVYPPAYAAECEGAHDHVRLEALAVADADADAPRRPELTATLCWLEPSGERHRAVERRAVLGPIESGERTTTEIPGGRLTLRSENTDSGGSHIHVRACVHNTREVALGLDRAAALASSLLSVHLVIEISGGRFVSPLEAGLRSVNIWPVLTGTADGAVLGAGIVLPDHPQLAPGSHGNLFDNTEIEEALVLHVQTLSDSEREAALAGDRVVGDMLERALALGPEEIMALHSGLSEVAVPREPAYGDPEVKGERATEVDGRRVSLGDTVVLRPGTDRDPYDRMLDGRRATVERIYIDSDDRVQLAITVDDVPGQDLLRETGRYLFFFAHEVAVP